MKEMRLEVKPNRLPSVSAVVLGLVCVPLGLGSLYAGLAGGPRLLPVAAGVLMLALFGFVFWLVRRGRRRSVKYFGVKGLERNDGRSFAWPGLRRVVDQVRVSPSTGRRVVWRTEIQFGDGESAWLIPSKISNYDEVEAFVRSLDCEHAEEAV